MKIKSFYILILIQINEIGFQLRHRKYLANLFVLNKKKEKITIGEMPNNKKKNNKKTHNKKKQ